ncbi:hypothetical protein [Flagellimonas maritima]|nr:hypothetical protein [Allomuricauda aurantiaca]
MKAINLEFRPYGNLGIKITEKAREFCKLYLGNSVTTVVVLRCQELQNEMFVMITPFNENINIGFFDISYVHIETFSPLNNKGLKCDASLYYSNGRLMLLDEMITNNDMI